MTHICTVYLRFWVISTLYRFLAGTMVHMPFLLPFRCSAILVPALRYSAGTFHFCLLGTCITNTNRQYSHYTCLIPALFCQIQPFWVFCRAARACLQQSIIPINAIPVCLRDSHRFSAVWNTVFADVLRLDCGARADHRFCTFSRALVGVVSSLFQ